MKVEAERLIGAIGDMVFCYGLAPQLLAWRDGYGLYGEANEGVWFIDTKVLDDDPMLEAVWAICVSLFGGYADTIRTGYIDDIDGFKKFLNEITELSQNVEDDLF